MEFGLFMNGYLPGPAAHDPACEHEMLMRELGYAIHADRFNWKYAWFGEHHALTEYSHMSAPEVAIPYVAAQTERIHLGSAIINLSPPVNQPPRNAERVAMLDHITEGRFEFGTGRGAGQHEMQTFDLNTSETKEMWNEVAPEIVRMWEQRDYTFEGEHFRVPSPHNILPKPYGVGHPPIWVGCGNPGTFTTAGELGIGAIAFNFEPIHNLKGRMEAYKEGIANCTEPLGEFVNDNIMMTNAVVLLSDRKRAREIATSPGRGYLNTMLHIYHSTMPVAPDAVYWPDVPRGIQTEEELDWAIGEGYLLCGTPEEVCEQLAAYESVGTDQLVFAVPNEGFEHEEVLEMIELFGTKVIPEFDKDPVHRTTHMRQTATRKHPEFGQPIPADLRAPEVIPTNALKPLGS
ncbi:MAG: LLM class flavin-dependent oxidoreductase [Acidimicrobiales bacterium]|nr:LLM class flavin-dependent oxidoreductase [Acidimicrobiales bacterium]